jgi:hypothetical protein
MRPARRFEPPPEGEPAPPGDLESPAKRTARLRGKPQLVIGLSIAAVALAGGAIGLWTLLSGPRSTGPAPVVRAPVPPRVPFAFTVAHVAADNTGRAATSAVRSASEKIAGQLSSFYDAVFMDPATWKNGVPDRAWSVFDPSVRTQARQDGEALTLGSHAATLKSVRVEDSSLSVEVLVDPRGNLRAAVATVRFDGVATLVTGQEATVTNKASFLLQPAGQTWLVAGYPTATTSIETVTPSPSPLQSPSPGSSAGPTPTGTNSP